MSRRTIFFLLLILGSLILFIFQAKAEVVNGRNETTCEDGEKFIIEEKGIVQTSNLPGPKDDLIIIDLRKLQLRFYRDGQSIRTYPVAIGESETPSPIGEWKVIHKGGNWGNGFGERWIGLNVPWGIYGIHGTNKPWTIGNRSSHGCIRMFNKHVLELYGLVKLGTPVHIIGDLPKVSPRKEVGRNNTGRDIVAFQFALRKAGFEPGIVDGRFGADMEQAVYKMQFFYGLAPTGKISFNEQIILGFR
jgi:hypothetical protein